MAIIVVARSFQTTTGTPDSDSIVGSSGPDLVFGAPGDDTIVSSAQFFGDDATPDTLRGGAGNDVITLNVGYGGLLFGDNGDDTLSVSAPSSTVASLAMLEGGPGNDVINGGVGATSIAWAGYITATSGVQVNLGLTTPQAVGGGAGVDTLSNLSGVVGSDFNDTIIGGRNAREELFGGPGDDRIQAGPNGGFLQGDTGDDTLVGGAGPDWAVYGVDVPKLNLELPQYAANAGVHVDLSLVGAQAVGGGLGLDTLVNIDNLKGSNFADTLSGNDGANTIMGGPGGDSLSGGAGNDQLIGENGADTLIGGAGDDTLTETFGANVLLGGDGNDSVQGGLEFDDVNGGQGDDTLLGGLSDDWVRGGRGDDSVSGGDGADFVSGDRGNDTLSGGAGADVFHGSQDAGIDRVLDFSSAQGDRVMLDPGTTYSVSQVGADTMIDMGGGHQMILVGVQMATLTPGWIFLG